jgi:hypothetical protein
MFDEFAKELEGIKVRSDRAVKALGRTKKMKVPEAIENIQAQLPVMKTKVEPMPMFDDPKAAEEAAKDRDLILLESLKKNMTEYVNEGK